MYTSLQAEDFFKMKTAGCIVVKKSMEGRASSPPGSEVIEVTILKLDHSSLSSCIKRVRDMTNCPISLLNDLDR